MDGTQRTSPAPTAECRPGRPLARIHELDALRGFAMCGIVFMNILQVTGMPQPAGAAADHPDATAFAMAFDGRFFPIFSFMFGLSFAIILRNAAGRHPQPRLLLLRRLVVLGLLGVAHSLLQPAEVLRMYAVFGVVILLPVSYLPRRWLPGLGLVLLAAPMALGARGVFVLGPFLIPGLFVLGMAASRYELPETLDRRGRQLAAVALGAAVLSALAGWYQYAGPAGAAGVNRAQLAGVPFALLFAAAFLLILRTPVGRPVRAVFAPLGRMALTNYLLATVLIVAAAPTLHLEQATRYGTIVALGAVIGVVQAAISPVWLRHFRYGPAEWAWRCLTWWHVVPLRRS